MDFWTSGGLFAIFVLANLHLTPPVAGHVRLDFPEARWLNLDFLDSVRTPAPCGMPKAESKTSFEAGTSFNVTWHLGYPHQGGFKIELLDAKDQLLQSLTPEDGGSKNDGWMDEDTTAQSHLVTLPKDDECIGCTLRLLRSASEWSQSYQFWSCADIDIVKPGTISDESLCSHHGFHNKDSDVCECESGFHGKRCQYKNECETDEDCKNGGSCVDIQATTFPSKQCFCPFGYFGPSCERKSELIQPITDLTHHETRQLDDNVALYWKVIEDTREIEVIMKGKTSSYMALGWRPQGTESSCQAFPNLVDTKNIINEESESRAEPEVEPESRAEPNAEPEGKAEPDAEPEGRAEPDAEPEGRAEPDAEPEGRAEPNAEPEGKAEPDAEREGRAEPVAEPEGRAEPVAEPEGRAEPDAEPEGRAEPDAEPEGKSETKFSRRRRSEPEPESRAEPEGQAEPEGRAEPEGQAEPEGRSEPQPEGKAEPEVEPETKSGSSHPKTPYTHTIKSNHYRPHNDKIHPMDCTDIIIGMARGKMSRIYDAYTRDRSTPLADNLYGGKDDLTSALGYEEDGMTTIIFRKKLEGSEETDHSIINDLFHVIWAYGQKEGMYDHRPPSGLESGSASIQDFYRPDEVKYHGKANRGVVAINFFDVAPKAPCMNSWRYPTNCKGSSCLYEAKWKPVSGDSIEFVVRQKVSSNSDDWIAIGFSNNNKMIDTDIVAGFSEVLGQGGMVKDLWASRYSIPDPDSSQDLFDESIRLENGFRIMTFKRKVTTDDPKDISFENEIHLVFPYTGGPMFGTDTMGKHKAIPVVTDTKIRMNMICEGEVDEELEDKKLTHEEKLKGAEILLNSLVNQDAKVAPEPEAQAEPKGFDGSSVDEGSCQQDEWKYPEGCSDSDCQYMAKWTKVGENIKVSVQGRSDFQKDWIGIGFSANPFMARTDAVIGYVDEAGNGVVKDMWIASYNPPDEDSSQDIKVLEVGKRDGVTFMKFLKKITSDDLEKDVDFNRDLHLIFPYAGGPVIAAGTIGKHRDTPESSPEKINFVALCG